MFQRIRAGLLVTALAGAAVVAPATAATASYSCGTGPQITTTRSSTAYYYDPSDWYSYDSGGAALVALATTSTALPLIELRVWDQSCTTVLCSSTMLGSSAQCAVDDYTGRLNIEVYYFGSCCTSHAYTLTAASTPSVGGTDCDTTNGVEYCATTEIGGQVAGETVYDVETYTRYTHNAAGWVDVYRFPLAGGASATLPCVVLKVDGGTSDPCLDSGGEFVTRLATLVNQNVNEPSVRFGDPLASVHVCTARYTLTVSAIGVEDVPAYALC